VFQAPSAWIWGRKRRYRVNETQKAQLLAIITPRRPKIHLAAITAGVLGWTVAVSTMMWLATGRDEPTGADIPVLAALILVPMVLALVMALRRNLRRMQPILCGAKPTDQVITRTEQRQALTKSMSFARALTIGAIWATAGLMQIFTLGVRNAQHPLFGDVQSCLHIVTAIAAAVLAVRYLSIALRKKM
jgi:hypothetical protein